MKYIIFEETDNIGIIKFNNPKALNALNSEFLKELNQLLIKLSASNNLKGLILTGEGKAFIAGGDIKEMQRMDAKQFNEFALYINSTLELIENFPKPIVAAVNGFAVGGGLMFALSADFIYASEKAMFGYPELKLGVIPVGGHRRLVDQVGIAYAKELIFSGKNIDAEEALRVNLINKIIVHDELINEVMVLSKSMSKVNSSALSESKKILNCCLDKPFNRTINEEYERNEKGLNLADFKEGVNAFLEKRKALWK